MELLKQPNRWTCLPTSLAMVIDKQVSDIIKMLGHDGSEIVWSDEPEPKCRRCFSMQEIIDVAYKYGYAIVGIDALPVNGPDPTNTKKVYSDEVTLKRLTYFLEHHNGILTGETILGKRHAVAWNREKTRIYDPNGFIYPLEKFIIETLWIVLSIRYINNHG